MGHELRTTVARARALVEVGMADPDASYESLRATCERVLVVCSEQEATIEALITLTRSRGRLEERDPVDLRAVVARVLEGCAVHATSHDVRLEASLGPSDLWGNECLLERLVTNLVDNAIVHNHPGGWVDVVARSEGPVVVLGVTNSGAVVPAATVDDLTRPFRRLAAPGPGRAGGSGLGLSIVAEVASAHGAVLELLARPGGGLAVTLTFR